MNQNTIRFVDLDIEGELNKQKEVGYIEVKQPESHDESEQPDTIRSVKTSMTETPQMKKDMRMKKLN